MLVSGLALAMSECPGHLTPELWELAKMLAHQSLIELHALRVECEPDNTTAGATCGQPFTADSQPIDKANRQRQINYESAEGTRSDRDGR